MMKNLILEMTSKNYVNTAINGERVLTIESNCLSAEVSLEQLMRLTMGGN